MWLVVLLLILAAICFGFGFVVKWLFLAAIVLLLVALFHHFSRSRT